MTRRTRVTAWLAAALVALGLSAAVAYMLTRNQPGGIADIGGPIDLASMNGGRFTDADIGGKPYAIFFGFTRCPNVCPTTLSDLTLDLDQLGPLADKIQVVFVSVDPDRDTPATMKEYLSAFDPRIMGVTGTPDEIAAIAKDYRVFYRKVPTDSGDYTMDHTASVYLMNAKGHFVGTLAFEENRDTQLAKLKKLAENG
ncbi:SCO family protein [Kaistia algarum]|uniref:SCO family protein n=1 Tax=Kaistia algarum TaxID=2083279 RepID=UPI000CE7A73D|nr:SCO family protein [Kaistia algarum]MCX5512495.1 SCO family protein [Kaistia algarum]PPE81968.1 SCO family protein [Kaistia algarum]